MIPWMNGLSQNGWLTGPLMNGWSPGWLTGPLDDWLVPWMADWSPGWMAGPLKDQLMAWEAPWLPLSCSTRWESSDSQIQSLSWMLNSATFVFCRRSVHCSIGSMGEGAAKIYEVGEGQISRAGRLLWTSVRLYFYISWCNTYHRGGKGREEKKGEFLPSQLDPTSTLLVMVTLSPCYYVKAIFLDMETKLLLPLLWKIQRCKIVYLKHFTNFSIVRPQSQFSHSCVCQQFIYSHDWSAYSACRKYVDRSWECINRSQTHECGNWDWGRAIPRRGIHKWDFRCSAAAWQWHSASLCHRALHRVLAWLA